jgi:hypothetical protein
MLRKIITKIFKLLKQVFIFLNFRSNPVFSCSTDSFAFKNPPSKTGLCGRQGNLHHHKRCSS